MSGSQGDKSGNNVSHDKLATGVQYWLDCNTQFAEVKVQIYASVLDVPLVLLSLTSLSEPQ